MNVLKNLKVPLISVIVPARNEEKHIQKCVQSLVNLEYPKKEVIFINDGSTDKTLEILGSYSNLIKIINTPGIGPSRARNMAIKAAQGEYIVFTDADCIVDKNWLNELLAGFTAENVSGVGGSQESPQDLRGFGRYVADYFRVFGFASEYFHEEKGIVEVSHNPTCNVAYKKKVFDIVGDFREDLWPCEDLEFDIRLKRLGLKLMNNPKAIVFHYRPETFRGFLRMMYRYGKAHSTLNLVYGFTQLLHYIPLVFFLFCIINVMLYKYRYKYLIILYIILFSCGVVLALSKLGNLKRAIFALFTFCAGISSWLSGFFVGGMNAMRTR